MVSGVTVLCVGFLVFGGVVAVGLVAGMVDLVLEELLRATVVGRSWKVVMVGVLSTVV